MKYVYVMLLAGISAMTISLSNRMWMGVIVGVSIGLSFLMGESSGRR